MKKTATKKPARKAAKKAPRKKASKAATKKTPSKGGRPKTDQAKLDAGVLAYSKGAAVEDAAKEAGIGKRTLERELQALNIERDEQPDLPELDHEASSIEVAKQGLRHAVHALRQMKPTHRSFAVQQQVVQRWLEKLRQWEREEARVESPEQEKRRLRTEEGKVIELIEQTVSAYEDEARDQGVCLWCGQPVSPELAAELHGDSTS